MHTRRSILKGTATALVAASSMPVISTLAAAKAPFAEVQAPAFYRMKVGSIEVTALSDGTIPIPLASLYTNTTDEHAQSALAAAFQGTQSETSVNAFLINTGERLVLIDAGTGSYLGPKLGKLIRNIEASGYKASDIDDVILTHIHTDHSGGLSADGERLFANAVVRVNKRDVDFWLDPAKRERATGPLKNQFVEAQQSLAPYLDAGRLETFDDDVAPVAGIGSILRSGHTPGHSSLVIESEREKMVFWGDITHGDVLQFDEPGVAIEFDVDQQKAVEARRAAFVEAASERYWVAGAHIAFPGIGHLRTDDTNYDWVPVNYTAG
ncbi:MBL fold metallo-hydrolase [Sinorhizobium sp. 7-81]|uniref:MBL fold metallo-hydrolase n=1 Tax=Sinorhizobium sp. 8-89 TaxID=3049089 RepID=UPI0024C3C733|nr:MBL fold metallo-hydrolase [Sinorhizobium sp. 8-89]MDK1490090.1 MBL fold metallo-hydrolase [Sinorhizobium sp. 8-89]